MTIQYQITRSEEHTGITIWHDGETYNVPGTHRNFEKLVLFLAEQGNEDEILELAAPEKEVSRQLQSLSERVRFANGVLYFDGDAQNSALSDHIVRMLTEEDSESRGWAPFVLFLEKLHTNPNPDSIEALFDWITQNGITITDDGDFLAYKGVLADGTSNHAGYGIVNGEVFERANLDNSVGNVIEIPRKMVDDNTGVTCSVGLHVGTHSYASGFAPRLLTAKVNPRDVVSVPSDHTFDWKLRVCRYTVLEVTEAEIEIPTWHSEIDPDADWEPGDEPEDADWGEPEAPAVEKASKALTFEQRVEKMRDMLKGRAYSDPSGHLWVELSDGYFRRIRNKEVTSKNREAFDVALAEARAAAPKSDFEQRVDRMTGMLLATPAGANLNRLRNKELTRKNRLPFDEARKRLGR